MKRRLSFPLLVVLTFVFFVAFLASLSSVEGRLSLILFICVFALACCSLFRVMHELYEPDENNLPNHANVLEKIENGTVTLGDLLDPELLGAIEKYLERKYRENDLTIDPGIEILEDPDFEKFLESLIKDV